MREFALNIFLLSSIFITIISTLCLSFLAEHLKIDDDNLINKKKAEFRIVQKHDDNFLAF